MASGNPYFSFLEQTIKKQFDSNRRVLTLEEYFALLAENPEKQLRGSAQYTVDMMDHFGKHPVGGESGSDKRESTTYRFHLFDEPIDGTVPKVVGQEVVQTQIYRALKSFGRQGINNKLLLLHGPNGSAKSSLIHAMMGGLERYSHEPAGALYTFNWVFPVERYTKGGLGINTYSATKEAITSYAKLADEEVASRLPCEMRDHPLLLIPVDERRAFIEKMIGKEKTADLWPKLPTYLSRGDLCHRCRNIFDALLTANNGDIRKILMHVQVERTYFSRRYRKGLVTIEPQLHVDAHYQQLTMNRSVSAIPPSLQSLNLFSLSGDLVDGNRGMIEYSDLLKRPIDSFKYLLIACETGNVNVGSTIAYLDTLMLGSANELQLDAFKEFPDFTSFKARIELIRVPYLLAVHEEREIYRSLLPQVAGEKHIAPHVDWTIALWAVLSRLKKPNSINYPPSVSTLVSNLTPLEKAKLYDNAETPAALTAEDRKLLRSALRKLAEEYINVPYYEGRMGASARELKSILFDAAQNPEFPCLSPLSVLRAMEDFVKRVTEYEFLKQDVKDGYHDCAEFIQVVRNEYLGKIDFEIRDSMGLYNSAQWEDFLKKYVQHVSLVLKKEKIKNPITGRLEDPDIALINEFEKIMDVPEDASAKASFRQNIISQVGAWSLDHPNEPVIYAKVFPEFWRKLEKHYYESQKTLLTKMHNALLVYGKEGLEGTSLGHVDLEGEQLAQQTVKNMEAKLGYCRHCAKEAIIFLMRSRY